MGHLGNPGLDSFNYGNGVTAGFGYRSDTLQLSSLSYKNGPTTLFSLNYDYIDDPGPGTNNGQIRKIIDNVDAGRTITYTYDALKRLKTAETVGSATNPLWGLSWTYDRYGNRKEQTKLAGTPPESSHTFNSNTNRITTTGFAYDASGNMISDGVNTLAYDAESRMVRAVTAAGTTDYSYDGNGLRVKKASGTNTTVYVFSGSKAIAEYVNGVLDKEYVSSGGQLVATHEGATTSYHQSDHLSLRLTTDVNGAVIEEQGHYPFGESWYTGGANKWQFTTYERDSETGYDYALARYDASELGRFNSADAVIGSSGNPQSLNRYPYVRNDPVNLVDPSGQRAFYRAPGAAGSSSGGGSLPWDADLQKTFHPGWGIPEDGFFTGASTELRIALFIKGVVGIVLTEEEWNILYGDEEGDEKEPVVSTRRGANCPIGSNRVPISSDPFASNPDVRSQLLPYVAIGALLGGVEYGFYWGPSGSGFVATGPPYLSETRDGKQVIDFPSAPEGTTINVHTHIDMVPTWSRFDNKAISDSKGMTFYLFAPGGVLRQKSGQENPDCLVME